MNTLIVDDNPAFRRTLTAMLGARFPSMVIQEAGDAGEAMSKIVALLPDLIFMDIKLPGINGLQLTEQIKAVYPRPQVIVLTSYDLPEYREASFRCGATHFLTKGAVTAEEIARLVESVCTTLGLSC